MTGRNINITMAIKKICIFVRYICCRDSVFPIFAETSASLVSPDLLPLLLDAWEEPETVLVHGPETLK